MSAPILALRGQIPVPAELWREFQENRAAAAAHGRKADALRAQFGLPEAGEDTIGEWSVTDGNGHPIGKFTVARQERAPQPAKTVFVGRLS